jgi:DNA-directed RNA polymerase sigma subunit (sigma70/sigma32)
MVGSLSWITDDSWPSDAWPSDAGWPYPDADDELVGFVDPDATLDDDLVSMHALAPHLLDDLEPLERQVIVARFGLDGSPVRSLKQLAGDFGASRADLRSAMGGGLAKLRDHLG